MFQSIVFADADEAREFDARMHQLLCAGEADKAAREVLGLLDRLEGGTHPIAALCREATPDRVAMTGWRRIANLPASTSAVSFDLSWPGHYETGPAPDGGRDPVIETNFLSDGAGGVRFSACDRESLAAKCGRYGVPWQGAFDDISVAFQINGLARLNGAVWNLACLGRQKESALSPADRDALQLGQVFIAVSLYRAVDKAVRQHGLPRPLAILIGSNEAAPHFHAPVVASTESEALSAQNGSSSRLDDAVDDEPPAGTETGNDRRRGRQHHAGREKLRPEASDLVRAAAVAGFSAMLAASNRLPPGQRKLARAFIEDLADLVRRR